MNLRRLPHKSRSQSMQDVFAYNILGDHRTYIEIGAYKPEHKNNTYVLETSLGYRGFSIEHNLRWQPMWEDCKQRTNSIYWADALTFDYDAACQEQSLPTRIGYLSCDIEPPTNTLAALQRTIEQGLSFDCVTFEHDRLSPKSSKFQHHNIEQKANDFMLANGYKVAVYDVWAGGDQQCLIETWYVNQDIDHPCVSFREWRQQYEDLSQQGTS
jgi:hypothetical protein